MSNFYQNTAAYTRTNLHIADFTPTGNEDPAGYISRPNHPYWRARIAVLASRLSELMGDEARFQAAIDQMPDGLSSQQFCYKLEAKIELEKARILQEGDDFAEPTYRDVQ
jgi:hypothetical protein